jgi:acyl carrier protein
MSTEAQLRKYILQNFMYTDDESRLTREMSLIDNGVIDSTGVLELVSFIEESFGVKVEDTELVPDNFDSVTRLLNYIERKQKAA